MLKLLALILLLPSIALGDAPVIWSGTTARWLPGGLQVAGLCKRNATGIESTYVTDGLVKMSSGVPGAAASGTDFAPPTAGTAIQKGNGSGGFSSAIAGTDYQVAGNYITALTSDVTATAITTGSVATTLVKIQGTAITGTTGAGSVVLTTGSVLTDPVVGTQATSDNSTKAASTAFVQTALAQLNPAAAVVAASTANIPGTYTNAVGGVCIGDTFQVTSTAAFAPDGVTLTVGQRFLMKDQTSTFQNGVWTLTTAANVGVLGALLTRALDFDSSADIAAGQIIPISGGTVNAGASWYQTAANTTCNSDAQTWVQFQKASSAYASSALTNSNVYVGNSSGVATGVAISSDCTILNTGAMTCTKTNGSSFAPSATTDTTNGANITTGSIALARTTLLNQALSTCTTARTVDWSTGTSFTLTLTSGNACTLTFSNPASGQSITLWLTNGSAGGTATVVWPTAKWFPAGAPTMTTGSAALDVCTCTFNGTAYACNCLQNGG